MPRLRALPLHLAAFFALVVAAAASASQVAVPPAVPAVHVRGAAPGALRGFTVDDLVSLEKPGSARLSPDGERVAFVLSQYDRETGKSTRGLRGIDLAHTASREFFPPFKNGKRIDDDAEGRDGPFPEVVKLTEGEFKDAEPAWLDNATLAFVSDRKAEGHQGDANGIWWIRAGSGPSEPKLLFQPPIPISNLLALPLTPTLSLLFFTAAVHPSAPTLEGTLALREQRKASQGTAPRSSARVFDDLYVRHWDEYLEAPDVSAEQLFVLPVRISDAGPEVAGNGTNLMAGTLWSTPVGPFGGSEDIAVGKSALGWRHFGREAAGEGVHRVQAVFTSRRPAAGSERAWTTDTSLFLVLLTVAPDMQIRLHTAPTDMTPLKTYASGPALDPGGTNMAYLETREPGNESDRRRVVVLSLPGFLNATLAGSTEKQRTFGPEPGYKRTLFPEWDRSPSSLSWSESGLWMAVEEHARVRAFLAPAPIPLPGSAEDEGPEPLRISHKGAARNLLPLPPIVLRAARPGPGGPPDFDTESLEVHRAFGFRSRAHEPDEGWVFWMARRETGMPGDGSGKPEVRLERGGRRMTDLHAGKLAGIALPEPEGFKFRSHGSEVHAWSFRPANHTPEHKAWPLAVLIHGGPEGAWTDSWGGRWNYQCFTGAGWWVIAINPRGSTGYGQRFTDAVRKDWGGRPYDDLMKGVDEALARFPVDAGRTVALGASYGGFMINWINGHTERFRALVCHDGLFSSFMNYYATDELFFPESEFGGAPFSNAAARLRYEEFNPERFVGRWRTPTLVVHGERDYRLGVEQGIAAFTALRRRGVPARLVLFPDENHWVLRPVNLQRWYAEVLGWIGRHGLGPRAQAPG